MYENAEYASNNQFLTAVQANELGMHIRKGEHAAARVIRMVEVDRRKAEKESDGDVIAEENGKCLVMKTYAVFHASQLDPGLPPVVNTKASVAPVTAVGTIVTAMKETGLKIAEGPFEPVFIPKLDLIRMPPMSSFKGVDSGDTEANFYGTLLHEIAHSVGAPKRLARFGMSQMTLRERAMEELVAEWSAAMMCSSIKGIKLGDDHVQQHSAYLASWMQALKDDKSAIFKAAAAAQRTCDYLDQLIEPKIVLGERSGAEPVEKAQALPVPAPRQMAKPR